MATLADRIRGLGTDRPWGKIVYLEVLNTERDHTAWVGNEADMACARLSVNHFADAVEALESLYGWAKDHGEGFVVEISSKAIARIEQALQETSDES